MKKSKVHETLRHLIKKMHVKNMEGYNENM